MESATLKAYGQMRKEDEAPSRGVTLGAFICGLFFSGSSILQESPQAQQERKRMVIAASLMKCRWVRAARRLWSGQGWSLGTARWISINNLKN
jgi:hypothetical protein